MAAKKKEEVSTSFHYLIRVVKNGDNEAIKPISLTEFADLHTKMLAQKPIDIKDEKELDRLRFRSEAPLANIKKPKERIITGTFKASYWGHGYDNTEKGRISANSVNLRPFHFVLYLSENGKIYIGSQYLGPFGGYEILKTTILSMLSQRKEIRSISFRLGAAYYANAQPREIRINVVNRSSNLTGKSQVKGKMTIALTRENKSDPLVEKVKKNILPFFGGQKNDIQKAVAGLINQSDLITIADHDVVDCTVLAEVNGKTSTIHMFDMGHHASRFPLDLPVDKEGHPANTETCDAILKAMNEYVISIHEDE